MVRAIQRSTAGRISVPFHQGTPKFKPPTRTHTAQEIQKIQFFSRNDSKPPQQRIRRVTTGKILIGKVGWWEGKVAGMMVVRGYYCSAEWRKA